MARARRQRRAGGGGLRRIAIDVGLCVTSIVAVVVAGMTYYEQHVAQRSRLHAKVMDFAMAGPDRRAMCRVDLAIFNPGNRDAAITRVVFVNWNRVETEDGFNQDGDIHYAENDDGIVVRGGEILLTEMRFPQCTPRRFFEALRDRPLIGLVFETLDHRGRRSRVDVEFGHAPIFSEDWVAVNLSLGDTVDLLWDGAMYRTAMAPERVETLTLRRLGEDEFEFERTGHE